MNQIDNKPEFVKYSRKDEVLRKIKVENHFFSEIRFMNYFLDFIMIAYCFGLYYYKLHTGVSEIELFDILFPIFLLFLYQRNKLVFFKNLKIHEKRKINLEEKLKKAEEEDK